MVLQSALKSGRSRSCGCLRDEVATTHGMSRTGIYRLWRSMLQRCANPQHHAYAYYGGRGITVCKRWSNFLSFYTDMGERPKGKSLERRDNNRGYSAANCYWATLKEQGRNRRNNRYITYNGITKTLPEWAELFGIKRNSLASSICRRGEYATMESLSRRRNLFGEFGNIS